MKAEGFTEGELHLLKLAFKLVNDVVEMQMSDNYDVDMSNALYSLKEKLGVCDLID